MITADTITDEQIRELHDDAVRRNDLVLKSDCSFAVFPEARIPAGHEARYARDRRAARARCAEILNTRIAARRCSACGALCDHSYWDGISCPWCRNRNGAKS